MLLTDLLNTASANEEERKLANDSRSGFFVNLSIKASYMKISP
jgi:hypothetical protein